MKLKYTVFFFFIFASFFIVFPSKHIFAANYQLSGAIKDNTGTAISGATIDVFNTGTSTNIGSTSSDSSGDYILNVPGGSADVRVTPPSGSNFSPAIAYSQNISASTILNFILTNAGTVTLSGHIYSPSGSPIPNAHIVLGIDSSTNGIANTTTDAAGSYSLTVPTGSYVLQVYGFDTTVVSTPEFTLSEGIFNNRYSLSQSTMLDITIPEKRVSVHVQDASGNPVSNVQLKVSGGGISKGLALSGNLTDAGGDSDYNSFSPYPLPITDGSGNAVVWLIPNSPNTQGAYTIGATPPSGSNYLETNLSNVTITDDTNETITLQQPVTLSGHVYDSLGNPAQNVHVVLGVDSSTNGIANTATDATGSYSLTVPTGSYVLQVYGGNNTSNLPPSFNLNDGVFNSRYTITQNTDLDITIPVKKVSIHVQDASGNAISNVQLTTNSGDSTGGLSLGGNITDAGGGSSYDPSSGFTLPVTDTSGNTVLWLLPNYHQPYIITATPPSESAFSQTNLSNITITGDTSETITLQQPVTLSGHIYDPLGSPIPNVHVVLGVDSSTNGIANTTTDSSGSYSLQVPSGNYILQIFGDANTLTPIPNFDLHDGIFNSRYALNQNTTLDITVPLKKVSMHVQDVFGNPVSNVQLQINGGGMSNGLSIGGNITDAGGGSGSYPTSAEPSTDNSGNTVLWLIPNSPNTQGAYMITATPPSGSIYSTLFLNNITITSDQSELISLQYSHASPATTESLSPASDSQGFYSDPTTVSLSTTAASGYTVANTYYTVDGRPQQTYSVPFTVSGAGNHTITYWSVDNSGVTEAHNSKTFTIRTTFSLTGTVFNDGNRNGFQDTGELGYNGATITLNTGQTATTDANGNYSISDLPTDTYLESLTLPSDYVATTTNPVSVPLIANTTVNFGIASQPTPSNTGTPTPTPTLTPIPRQLTALNAVQIWMSHGTRDNGIKLDILAQVYADGILVSSGQINSVSVGSNVGPNGITSQSIPFNSFSPVSFPSGSQLSISIAARNACNGSSKNSGTANLWYNTNTDNTRFGATITATNNTYYFVKNSLLSTTAGTGPQQLSSIQAGAKCSAFKSFGTWTITP